MRSSGSGSNSENARTGMSLKGKDNQTASEDVLKLAPQVLYIFSQPTCFSLFRARNRWTHFAYYCNFSSAHKWFFIRRFQKFTGNTNLRIFLETDLSMLSYVNNNIYFR